jgi:hypothetical protein
MTRTEILSDAILAAANQPRSTKHDFLTAFLGVAGRQYDHELMVVGRAVNGWDEWSPSKVVDGGENPLEIAKFAIKPSDPCPLAWVCRDANLEYNANRSAFWRTGRGVLDHVAPHDVQGCWASRLAWSNLCKLSGREGNPPEWLFNIQLEACKKILNIEISEFAPRRVLFSTGWDWARWFVTELSEADSLTVTGEEPLEAYGRLPSDKGSCLFVVAPHPRGKSETDWVRAVVEGFEAAEQM